MTPWTDDRRAEYLRSALDLVDGLPQLICEGRPDQVHLELARISRTIEAVRASLTARGPRVPPLAACEDYADA